MKFGVREICDVVLRAKTKMQVGGKTFYKNEPVLYFDTLTTSSLEGSATTSYAQGGRGNTRLMAWEGERTLTFNMTDALISPESFSVLSGASIYDAAGSTEAAGTKKIYIHTTSRADVKTFSKWLGATLAGELSLDSTEYVTRVPGKVCWNHKASLAEAETEVSATDTDGTTHKIAPAGEPHYESGADIFIMQLANGEISKAPAIPDEATKTGARPYPIYYYYNSKEKEWYSFIKCIAMAEDSTVLVDYYTLVEENKGKQIEITPDKFGGYFYLEASTLFRDEATGKDMPAEFIIPNCKIQSNFTFTMSSTGDPSTFDFVLDAFPDYTKFDTTTKVLAVIQILDDAGDAVVEEQREHSTLTQHPSAAAVAFEHKSYYNLGVATLSATASYTPTSYAVNDASVVDTIATPGRLYPAPASNEEPSGDG